MTLFLILVTLGVAVFWRQVAAALGAGLVVLLLLGILKLAELLPMVGS